MRGKQKKNKSQGAGADSSDAPGAREIAASVHEHGRQEETGDRVEGLQQHHPRQSQGSGKHLFDIDLGHTANCRTPKAPACLIALGRVSRQKLRLGAKSRFGDSA